MLECCVDGSDDEKGVILDAGLIAENFGLAHYFCLTEIGPASDDVITLTAPPSACRAACRHSDYIRLGYLQAHFVPVAISVTT